MSDDIQEDFDLKILEIIPCPECANMEAVVWDFNWANLPGETPYLSCFECSRIFSKNGTEWEHRDWLDAWIDISSKFAFDQVTKPYG